MEQIDDFLLAELVELYHETGPAAVPRPFSDRFLPARYVDSYDFKMTRRLYACLLVIAGRLQDGWEPPRCRGEELVLRAVRETHQWFAVAPLAVPVEAGRSIGTVCSVVVRVRRDRQLTAVRTRSTRPVNDCAYGCGADPATLRAFVDGHVPQLAGGFSMLDREDADDRPILGSHKKGFPPTATGADVGLGENDERDGLMIGNERELLVRHPHLEGLSPVPGINWFESHIVHISSQLHLRAASGVPVS